MTTTSQPNSLPQSQAKMCDPIVSLHYSQTETAARVLSAAFSRDPVMRHFLPEDKASQHKILCNGSAALIRYSQVHNQIYTTAGEIKGVAIWLPPAETTFHFDQLVRMIRSGLLTLPFQLPLPRLVAAASLLFEEFVGRNDNQPHWYLAMLGVSPEYQGQGVGGALLQPVLEQADREGLPCYLDTSTPDAVRFYERQGFAVVHHREIAPGVPFWKMQRMPSMPL